MIARVCGILGKATMDVIWHDSMAQGENASHYRMVEHFKLNVHFSNIASQPKPQMGGEGSV